MTSELTTMLMHFKDVSDKTKNNYKNAYNRVMVLTGNTPLSSLTDDAIVESINKADITPSAKITLLIVIHNVFVSIARDTTALRSFRSMLNENLKSANAEKAKTNDLPSARELRKHLNELYVKKQFREYTINFLLTEFNVRNMDLNCIITRAGKVDTDETDNWLIIKKSYVMYVRNNYKTISQHKKQIHKITNAKLLHAVNALIGNDETGYLLVNKLGNRFNADSIGNYIRRMTYNEIGEGKMFKILVSCADKRKTEKMSASRGTTAGVVLEYYDQAFQNCAGLKKT